jgi:lipopolysaccharide/colanic/teichoic acid biosynthesis glycosyltransferase
VSYPGTQVSGVDHRGGGGAERLRATIKRGIDVSTAFCALVVLSPAFLVIAVLIKLDSRGPVFYRAQRVGFGGRPLAMLKFRKMHETAGGAALTMADDDRFTRVGRWLMHTKLDELPQLWHVLRGDMSLVGPRPESPAFVERHRDDYEVILTTRPGLTGYSQLAFAREGAILDPEDPQGHYVDRLLPQKVGLDRMYASRLSTRRDLAILFATFATVALRKPVAVNRRTGALTRRRRPSPSPSRVGASASSPGESR